MTHVRDHKTPYLIDPWDYIGPRRRKLLEDSWAGLFRKHILTALPVHKIASCYASGCGKAGQGNLCLPGGLDPSADA